MIVSKVSDWSMCCQLIIGRQFSNNQWNVVEKLNSNVKELESYNSQKQATWYSKSELSQPENKIIQLQSSQF